MYVTQTTPTLLEHGLGEKAEPGVSVDRNAECPSNQGPRSLV